MCDHDHLAKFKNNVRKKNLLFSSTVTIGVIFVVAASRFQQFASTPLTSSVHSISPGMS